MIDGKRVVAMIPARGGSKTVPKKNLRDLGGKPLVAWPITVAQETPEIDHVVVSTDSEEIATVAEEWGAAVIERPDCLAEDDSLVIEAVRHTIDHLRNAGESPEYLVMLEPTSPFRTPDDVRSCLELLSTEGYDSVATFCRAELNPHRSWTIAGNQPEPYIEGADPWQPRQELPEAYQLNGGVYAFDIDALPEDQHGLLFGRSGSVLMPPERSIDIDTELDLAVARQLVENDWNNVGETKKQRET